MSHCELWPQDLEPFDSAPRIVYSIHRLKWLFQQVLKGSPKKLVMSFQKQNKAIQNKHTKINTDVFLK